MRRKNYDKIIVDATIICCVWTFPFKPVCGCDICDFYSCVRVSHKHTLMKTQFCVTNEANCFWVVDEVDQRLIFIYFFILFSNEFSHRITRYGDALANNDWHFARVSFDELFENVWKRLRRDSKVKYFHDKQNAHGSHFMFKDVNNVANERRENILQYQI